MNMGTGEVVPFERASVPAVKEDYTQAIQLWCQTRDIADALTREEIGAMPKFDRVDAHRKSLLINMSVFCRDNPRADVAVCVLALVTFLSDNDKGACQMSQGQMAAVLHRSRTTIAEAVTRLKASGVMRSVNGQALAYPTIPRAVTGSYNHMVWITDALKTAPTCPVQPTGRNLSGRADSFSTPVPSKRQVSDDTCRRDDEVPVPYSRHNFTKENSKEETTLEGARDARSLTKAIALGIAAAAGSLPLAAAPMEPPSIVRPASQEISYDELKAKLMEAGGEAIGISAGLEVLAVPRRWLLAGCDLNEDILPAIRARSAKMPPRSVNSWNYFEQAVADSKSTRLAPMPDGRAPPGKQQQRLAPWEEEQVRLKLEADAVSEKLRAKYKREMEEQGRG